MIFNETGLKELDYNKVGKTFFLFWKKIYFWSTFTANSHTLLFPFFIWLTLFFAKFDCVLHNVITLAFFFHNKLYGRLQKFNFRNFPSAKINKVSQRTIELAFLVPNRLYVRKYCETIVHSVALKSVSYKNCNV